MDNQAGVKWSGSSYWIGFANSSSLMRLPRRFQAHHKVEMDTVVSASGAVVSVVHDAYWEVAVIFEGAKYRGNYGTVPYSADSATYMHLSAWLSHAARGGEWSHPFASSATGSISCCWQLP